MDTTREHEVLRTEQAVYETGRYIDGRVGSRLIGHTVTVTTFVPLDEGEDEADLEPAQGVELSPLGVEDLAAELYRAKFPTIPWHEASSGTASVLREEARILLSRLDCYRSAA